jgi:hypothetical protein
MFDRNYELDITFDGITLEVRPPMRIVFDANKSIYGGLNKCTVTIYNLRESTRLRLIKSPEQNKLVKFSLRVGYQGLLRDVFRGQVLRGESIRDGVDYVTRLESLDGGFDLQNTAVSKTVRGKGNAIAQAVEGSQTSVGAITQQSDLIRPRVMVGNMIKVIGDLVEPGQDWYIDDGQLNIIKPNEVIKGFTPVVTAQSGLISTPTREQGLIEFESLINPSIKIGRLIELQSVTAPQLNGRHKVEEINYKGDLDGGDWKMTVKCRVGTYGTVN